MSDTISLCESFFQNEQTRLQKLQSFFRNALTSNEVPKCMKEEITGDLRAGFSLPELDRKWESIIPQYSFLLD